MLSLCKGGEIGKRPLTRGLWLTGRAHALQDFLLKKKKKILKRPRDQRTMGYKACPRLASSIKKNKKIKFGALVQGVQQMETALLVKLLR